MSAAANHLASIDALRIILCASVVAYHVVEETAALFPERGAPWERNAVIRFIYFAAPPAVDVFLMLAGCFCARGCQRIAETKWQRYALRIFSRWRRMAVMHAIVVGAAWALGDGRYFPGGRVDWLRVAATFGWKNYHKGWQGWYDLAATPLWSNYVDLHGTSLLVMLSALFGGISMSVAAAGAVASAAIRWAAIQRDPACLVEACLDMSAVATLFTTPGDAGAPGVWLGAAPLDRGEPYHCGSCPLDAAAWTDNLGTKLYVATHVRLAPLFVGAALAAALKNSRHEPKPLRRAFVLGLALWWAAETHALLDLGLRARVASAIGGQGLDALSGLTTATAWAVIVFASVGPDGHWLQVPAFRVPASPELRRRADLTFGVYCLHWPILMLCLRAARKRGLADSDAVAFGTIFVPTALGAVTCATLYDAFLTVCWGPDGHEPCTRDGKKYDFEKHDLRRSSSVLSGWESE